MEHEFSLERLISGGKLRTHFRALSHSALLDVLVDEYNKYYIPEIDKLKGGGGSDQSMILKETLDSFLLLPDGWDSYKSARFSKPLIAKAKEVADWLPGEGWQVVPCPGGGAVQFEKHIDGFDIEIYIEIQDPEGVVGA